MEQKTAPELTRSVAKILLEQYEQRSDVICAALNILEKDEAKPFARKLLEKSEQVQEGIIFVALRILEDEAKDFAKRILDNWKNKYFRIVTLRLHILSTSEQAEKIVSSILRNKRVKKRYYRCLEIPVSSYPIVVAGNRNDTSELKEKYSNYGCNRFETLFC